MRERAIKIHVDGGNVYGDLNVTGFATDRTALEVGADFADVLRNRWPGAHVTVEIVEPSDAK